MLVVGGGYVRGESGLLDRVREIVGRAVPYPPEVVHARFGADASLRGAVAAALTSDRGGRRPGHREPRRGCSTNDHLFEDP